MLETIKKIFNKNKDDTYTKPTRLFNSNTSYYNNYNISDSYGNDIFRSGIDAIARNAAKLKGIHTKDNKPVLDSKYTKLFELQPNIYMSSYDMLYKMITHYYIYNNSFAIINYNNLNIEIYPVLPMNVEFVEDTNGELLYKLHFNNREPLLLSYNEIIHLKRHYSKNEFSGDNNNPINSILEASYYQAQGITETIKNGANIRGILKTNQALAPSKRLELKNEFINDYLSMNNSGGIICCDVTGDYTPLNQNPVVIDDKQITAIEDRIYNYLGISKQIVNSTYTEDDYNAFYESVIEPLSVQLSLEFTRKLFNSSDINTNNRIVFSAGRFNYSSNTTKINLIKEILPYGIISINQALEILNLPPVEDGNKRLQTLNVVDSSIANKYQLGDNSNE